VAVTAYDADGNLVNCWALGHTRKENITENLSFDKQTAQAHLGSFLSAPHVETLFDRYYPWVVTMTARVDGGEEKWIALDLSFSSISSYINGVGIGQHGYCYIVDDDGNLIYHPQQQLIYYGLKNEETAAEAATLADGSYGNDTILYSVKSVGGSAWRIVGVSYVDEMVQSSVTRMLRQLLDIGALLMGITLAAGILVSRILSRPLRGLAGAMGSFEKDADHYTYSPVHGAREVHILSESFGHMVVRIQQLMARVRSEEVELRKTELKALQAQINPHFLYNTLDSIAWMCEQGRNSEAVQMVHALATLFRISISRGQELIPISKEIEHAKSYLQIEKYRYKDRFAYRFEVDPACEEFLCNKITLQPIIENAICHGLDMLEDEGCIEITVKQDGGDILFIVKDNGIGMTQQQADSMLNREASDRTGIGIKNVNDRLRIYFGEGYGLHIQSELDVGTTVEIRMPKVREGEYEAK
jgi:two-component system sensor histidine kinase YesM